jgi:hypothetical protein
MSGYIGTQPVPQATQTRDAFTATAGQTSFATGGYTPQFLDVFLNGVHLQNGTDFTATNGSDVVLTTGAALNDVLEVVAYSTFDSANTYNRTEADAEFVNDPDDVIAVSSGRVGINTTSPDFTLHVQDAGSNAAATVKLGDVYHGYVQQNANDLNIISNGDQAYRASVGTNNGTGNIVFQTAHATTGNTERMRIDSAGRVTMPYQPSFKVAANYGSPPYINGATLLYTAVEYDVGNNFANSRFTAPVTGAYHFDVSVFVSTVTSASGYSWIALQKNGSVIYPYAHSDASNITNYEALSLSRTVQLAANDYVQVYVFNHSSHRVFNGTGYNHFSGHFIG